MGTVTIYSKVQLSTPKKKRKKAQAVANAVGRAVFKWESVQNALLTTFH